MPIDVQRLAIIGDSFTTGYGVDANQSYVSLLEADDLGPNILPLAHNGSTVRKWNTIYAAELDQLMSWQPDTVLIALGGNDELIGRKPSDYQVDLTYLTWQVRVRVPNARVIYWHYYPLGIPQDMTQCDVWPCTPGPSTWHDYGDAMRQSAIINYAGYIDNSVRAPSGLPWSTYYLPDHIHLNPGGHSQEHDDIRARLLACC